MPKAIFIEGGEKDQESLSDDFALLKNAKKGRKGGLNS